jgi:folate/biopterin transporter
MFPQLVLEYGLFPVLFVSWIGLAVKGIVTETVQGVALPMLKDDYEVGPELYQRITTVSMSAWALKPLIGVISDNIPLGGYHKRSYMLIACMFGAIFTLTLTALPQRASLAIMFGAILFCVNLCLATLDLLNEGTFSALMGMKANSSSGLVSWNWGLVMIGSVVAYCLEGPLADAGHVRLSLGLCVPMLAFTIIPMVRNWACEVAVPRVGISAVINRGSIREYCKNLKLALTSTASRPTSLVPAAPSHAEADEEGDGDEQGDGEVIATGHGRAKVSTLDRTRICFFGQLVAVGAVLLAASAIAGISRTARLFATLALALGLSSVSFLLLPTVAAKANLYMFLKEMLYVHIPGALDYYFTGKEYCVPGGPQFSYTFYQTYTTILSALAGLAGVALFERTLANKSLRIVFYITTALKVMASMFDVLLVWRWNIKMGIPDKWFYIWGDSVVYSLCYMMDFVPASVLTAKLCPPGMESTMFALLAGFSNFGQSVAQSLGTFFVEYYGIVATPKECNFTQLPQLIIVAHGVLPLLAIPASYLLLPGVPVHLVSFTSTSAPAENSVTERATPGARAFEVLPTEDSSSPVAVEESTSAARETSTDAR